jgi:hypothetical protein
MHHPRGKATVHPTKLLVRRAMAELAEAGVELRDSGSGNRNLFILTKAHPERLPLLVQHIKASTTEEKALWAHVLREFWDGMLHAAPRGIATDGYETLMVLLPYVQDRVIVRTVMSPRNSDNSASVLGHARSTIHHIADALHPRVTDIDTLSLFKAAEIVLHIKQKIKGGAPQFPRTQKAYLDERINPTNIDDVLFIAADPDAVQSIVPELINRRTHDKGMVEALLRTPKTVLLEGVL